MANNRKHPHNSRDRQERTREAVYMEFVIEAIAYMEYQPSTAINAKCRRQLQEVAKYLNALDRSARLAGTAANHD